MARSHRFHHAFAGAILLGACCLTTLTHAAPGESADIQKALYSALGRGDVDAALALFTDDAVIDSESGDCALAPCVGKAAIRKDFERYVQDRSRRVNALNTYISGNVIVTRFEARSDTVQKAGVERVVLWGIREMRDGKIASSRCCLPERTDSQTAKFLSWENAQPAR